MSAIGLTGEGVLALAVFAAGGGPIGRLVDVCADIESGAVLFAGVAMVRRARRRLVFVSLAGARVGRKSFTVQCGRDLARHAPSTRPGQTRPADAEPELFAQYDIPYPSLDSPRARLRPCR